MEHVRVAVPPPKMPARNQSEPRCPTTQSSPVASSCGFTDVGIERAHCHHSALSFLRDEESALAGLTGPISPSVMPATTMKHPVLFFTTPSLWLDEQPTRSKCPAECHARSFNPFPG